MKLFGLVLSYTFYESGILLECMAIYFQEKELMYAPLCVAVRRPRLKSILKSRFSPEPCTLTRPSIVHTLLYDVEIVRCLHHLAISTEI